MALVAALVTGCFGGGRSAGGCDDTGSCVASSTSTSATSRTSVEPVPTDSGPAATTLATHDPDWADFAFDVNPYGNDVGEKVSETQLVERLDTALGAAHERLTYLPASAASTELFVYYLGANGFVAVGHDITIIERAGTRDMAAFLSELNVGGGYTAHTTSSAGGFDCLLGHIPGAASLECASDSTIVRVLVPDTATSETTLLSIRTKMLAQSQQLGAR